MGWYEQPEPECDREEATESGGTLLTEEPPMVVQSPRTLREHLRALIALIYWRTTFSLSVVLALIGLALFLLIWR